MTDSDDARELPRSADFYLGRLHSRVATLEERADKHDGVLKGMDGKLDEVLIVLAGQKGGNERMMTLAKFGVGLFASLGTIGGTVIAVLHYYINSIVGGAHG